MNDSFENYDMFSNKSYSDKKNLFLNLISLNENSFRANNFFSNGADPFLHLNTNRNIDKNISEQSSGSKSHLEEIFKCFICFGRVKNAQMCPHCSKLCCNNCIKKWLTEQKSQCPHCRAPLKVSQLVNCRFVTEITSALDNLHIKKEEEEELCPTHKNKLQYYCTTCQVAICSDCAMIGFTHKAHEFEHIGKTYDCHVEKIKKESNGLKSRLKELSDNLSLVQNSITSLKKNKDEKTTEITLILEQMNQKLETELKSKLVVLISQKNSVSEEIDFLENMKNELDRQIRDSPKNILISKSDDLIQMLKEINGKPSFKFNGSGLNFNFKSELVPEYDCANFTIINFSKIRKTKDIIYSDPLEKNGMIWRLKIYPNGNGVAKGAYLSIFLELVKGLQTSAKYEYRIEMINVKNPEICVIREFASDFESGECWGYNRFFKIEFLEKDGYLSLDNDSIMIKYYIRALNYHQKSIDQENYIRLLETERIENLEKIKAFEKKKEKDSHEKESDKQEKIKDYVISHEIKKEEESISLKNSKSIRENPKEPEKMSTHKLPEIFMNKQTDFSMNYFTNMDTQIESVKHTSIPLMEENYKEKAKKISNEMQISIEKIFMENETSHHIQQLDEKCSFNEEEEEDDEEMEEDNQENHYSDSNGDSEHNEEDYQNPEPEIENEEIYLEGQNLPVCETEPNCNTNEDEESCKEEEEEEVKINQPQRESRENLKAYLNNNSETTKESNYIKECIFETGNMVKDANLLFNEDTNENHFISIDSICEKTEKSMKMSFKDESLVFREKNEKDNKSHIRNLLPNFEYEAINNKQKNSKSEYLLNIQRTENHPKEIEEQKQIQQQPKTLKFQANSISLSENLIKKIENIKYFNQKAKNKIINRSKDQKENVRTQENKEPVTEFSDNIQTC